MSRQVDHVYRGPVNTLRKQRGVRTCLHATVLMLALAIAACSSDNGPPTPALTSISLTPPSATIAAGETKQFIATGHFNDGSTAAASVDWTATGGTVNSGGLYTAGTTGGSFAVTATAHGGTIAQSATVTVTSSTPVLSSIVVTPNPITVATGGTQQFTATGHFTGGGTGSVTVDWTATGGSVNSAGFYTAGPTAGDFVVTATEHGGSIAGTAAVTLSVAPPTLTSITVAPTPVTIASLATKQFAATGHFSDGSTGGVAVAWTATGGTVDATGLYTAGTTDGNYQVTATSTGSAIAGHADVTISTAPPDLVAIEVSPTNVRIKPYDSLRFSAVGRLSDGGTMPVSVTWSTTTRASNAAVNSIRTDGEFKAGVPIGGFVVTATLQGGTLSGTAAGTVHETAGKTVGGPPLFWGPVAGAVYLCTSNHFTDDGDGLGGVATITAASGVVGSSTRPYTTIGAPIVDPDGTGWVAVQCTQVWQAPTGMVGSELVRIDVTPNRPGTGIAKIFAYTDPCLSVNCVANWTHAQTFEPNWTTAPVFDTATVSATTGANIWFKSTLVP